MSASKFLAGSLLTGAQMSGIWCLLFLGRWSMVLGWVDLIKTRLIRRSEFVSVDARRYSNDPRTYEMLSSTPQPNIKTPDPLVISPSSMSTPAFSPMDPKQGDYFGREAKYVRPMTSFSTPRPLSSHNGGREWDPSATHAQGGTLPGIGIAKS